MDEEINETQESNTSTNRTHERKNAYRILLDKIETIKQTENLGIQTVNELGEILREANLLDSEIPIEKRVGDADETILDCKVISSASSVLKRCIEAVEIYVSSYESSEFSEHIKRFINEEEDDISAPDIRNLIHEARRVVPDIPEFLYVFGTYDLNKVPEPKPKKERVKTVKEQLQKKQPEKVVNLDKEEETIEEIVKVFHEVLVEAYEKNNGKPVRYYDYIIDTESYANTIENMFYFAFLIRDGRAQIKLDENGKPIIKPIKKGELKQFRGSEGVNVQILTVVDMDLWESFKKKGLLQIHKNKSANSG